MGQLLANVMVIIQGQDYSGIFDGTMGEVNAALTVAAAALGLVIGIWTAYRVIRAILDDKRRGY